MGTVSKSAASLVSHNVVHPVKINNVCCATLIKIPLFCQGKHRSGAVSGTGLNHQYYNRGFPKPQKGSLSEFLIHREWLEINIIKRENIYTHNMNTLKKGCFAYGDQPQKTVNWLSPRQQGYFPSPQNTFPKSYKLTWINDICNRDAIFHIFLENVATLWESTIGQFVQFTNLSLLL